MLERDIVARGRDGTTGDVERSALLIDGRSAGNGAAGDVERTTARLVDRNILGGADDRGVGRICLQDVDDGVGCVAAVVADGGGVATLGGDSTTRDVERGPAIEQCDGVGVVNRCLHRATIDVDGVVAVGVDGLRAGAPNAFHCNGLNGAGLKGERAAVLEPDGHATNHLALRTFGGVPNGKRPGLRGTFRLLGAKRAVAQTGARYGVAVEVDDDILGDGDVGAGLHVRDKLDDIGAIGRCDCTRKSGIELAVNLGHSRIERVETTIQWVVIRYLREILSVLARELLTVASSVAEVATVNLEGVRRIVLVNNRGFLHPDNRTGGSSRPRIADNYSAVSRVLDTVVVNGCAKGRN